MKLELKTDFDHDNKPAVFIKVPDGTFRDLRWISKITKVPIKKLRKRLKDESIKTLEKLLDSDGKVNHTSCKTEKRVKPGGKRLITYIEINGKWKTVKQISEETGSSEDTIRARLKNGIDLYQPRNKGGISPAKMDNLWEGVPENIRIACESGSNKLLLEAEY